MEDEHITFPLGCVVSLVGKVTSVLQLLEWCPHATMRWTDVAIMCVHYIYVYMRFCVYMPHYVCNSRGMCCLIGL